MGADRQKGLFDALKKLAESDVVPMHMPGHKRNAQMAPYLLQLGAQWDITEIDQFDDLYHPQGVLKAAMDRAKSLWGSDQAHFLVNGSTGGILAGIRAATRSGDTVIMARGCHKSVYHAVELCGLNPVFLVPPTQPDFGFCGSITPQSVRCALKEHPQASLVVITSPTYEGVISDVAEIVRIAHERGAAVMVDEAHGAHLGLSDYFSGSAVKAGADIVIHSLHKTLPSLTQTAVAHLKTGRVSSGEMLRQLQVFNTSSPSYLLMSSMDSCVSLLADKGQEIAQNWQRRLEHFYEKTKDLRCLQVALPTQMGETVYKTDPSKLVIGTCKAAMSGPTLAKRLRQEYHIEVEMSCRDYIVAMSGAGDKDENLSRLADALVQIDATCKKGSNCQGVKLPYHLPKRACSVHQALKQKGRELPLEQAVGKVCGEYVWAYPPGVPLVIPGEILDSQLAQLLLSWEREGIVLHHTKAGQQGGYLVV